MKKINKLQMTCLEKKITLKALSLLPCRTLTSYVSEFAILLLSYYVSISFLHSPGIHLCHPALFLSNLHKSSVHTNDILA